MIFLVQFGINKQIFQRPQIALALRARAILLGFEKFTPAYLFQIALEIMWLPIQNKTKRLHKNTIPEGLVGDNTWLPWRHVKTPYEETLFFCRHSL